MVGVGATASSVSILIETSLVLAERSSPSEDGSAAESSRRTNSSFRSPYSIVPPSSASGCASIHSIALFPFPLLSSSRISCSVFNRSSVCPPSSSPDGASVPLSERNDAREEKAPRRARCEAMEVWRAAREVGEEKGWVGVSAGREEERLDEEGGRRAAREGWREVEGGGGAGAGGKRGGGGGANFCGSREKGEFGCRGLCGDNADA